MRETRRRDLWLPVTRRVHTQPNDSFIVPGYSKASRGAAAQELLPYRNEVLSKETRLVGARLSYFGGKNVEKVDEKVRRISKYQPSANLSSKDLPPQLSALRPFYVRRGAQGRARVCEETYETNILGESRVRWVGARPKRSVERQFGMATPYRFDEFFRKEGGKGELPALA